LHQRFNVVGILDQPLAQNIGPFCRHRDVIFDANSYVAESFRNIALVRM